jgi:hypothetical protein
MLRWYIFKWGYRHCHNSKKLPLLGATRGARTTPSPLLTPSVKPKSKPPLVEARIHDRRKRDSLSFASPIRGSDTVPDPLLVTVFSGVWGNFFCVLFLVVSLQERSAWAVSQCLVSAFARRLVFVIFARVFLPGV